MPLIISIAVSVGILIGLTLANYHEPDDEVRVSTDKFQQIVDLVHHQYVDSVDTELLTEHAIKKMLDKLDPHTVYIPKRDIELAQSSLESGFEGVGIEFDVLKDTLFVLNPLKGGPSYKAGIKAGDRIVSVDGKNIAGTGIKTRDVFDLLRGEEGSEVILGVSRRGLSKEKAFTVIRDQIPTYSIDVSLMIDDETGYIKLTRFARDTYSEFEKAMKSLNKKGMKHLILDLRDNGGGYLEQATRIIDELLPKGSLMVYTQGKVTDNDKKYIARKEGMFEDGGVLVLINENSASASEIVAGALQDNDRALIVGRRSFGKGLVQNPIPLNDGSELRLTVSRYYTPSGRCIQKPYGDDADSYDKEYTSRLKSGELFVEDSIKYNDSLHYQTLRLKRAVFGGGGVSPDKFVPRDTSEYSDYLGRLYAANTLREYAISYYNANEKKLGGWTLERFEADFEVTDKMLEDFKSVAKASGISFRADQFERSQLLIKHHIKSLIAKSKWENLGFYTIKLKRDEFIVSSLGLTTSADQLNQASED